METWQIVTIAVLVLGAATAIGFILWLPVSRDIGGRGDLGTGLITAAAIGFLVLGLQMMFDSQLQKRANEADRSRQQAADRQSLEITLGLRSNLQNFNLAGKDLAGFNLPNKQLREAIFDGANLGKTVLHGAHLERATFNETRMQFAQLAAAYLNGAILRRAKLQDAILIRADLRGARLVDAKLRRANLLEAKMQGARLCGADLRGAVLLGAELAGARYDDKTKWGDFDPESLPPSERPVPQSSTLCEAED